MTKAHALTKLCFSHDPLGRSRIRFQIQKTSAKAPMAPGGEHFPLQSLFSPAGQFVSAVFMLSDFVHYAASSLPPFTL